jgi:hypothetical protein
MNNNSRLSSEHKNKLNSKVGGGGGGGAGAGVWVWVCAAPRGCGSGGVCHRALPRHRVLARV